MKEKHVISHLLKDESILSFNLNCHEHSFDIIVGQSHGYNWISFPVIEKSCTLSYWSDFFWNKEQLETLFSPFVAEGIAQALVELKKQGNLPI